MCDKDYQQLKEQGWRRSLSPSEKARLKDYLAAHGQARQDWEKEERLNELLRGMPEVPVSSNFTARVLQAAQRAPQSKAGLLERAKEALKLVSRWFPRYAAAMLAVLCLTLVSVSHYQANRQTKMASDLVKVSQVASLPEMEWMKDFETINRISQSQVSDSELLTALR